jgi:threonine/homoserine/homoserine lactone efflux protein
MPLASLSAFLGASVILTLAPGPDNLFILSQGVQHGKKPAWFAAFGMCCGISIHTIIAAIGLGTLIANSASLFQSLKLAGAAYLLYLAFLAIRENPLELKTSLPKQKPGSLFLRGFLMNSLNPKVTLFFLAFLPQFVSSNRPILPQMLTLGGLFFLQALTLFSILAWISGQVHQMIQRNQTILAAFRWIVAALFLVLGLRLAFF